MTFEIMIDNNGHMDAREFYEQLFYDRHRTGFAHWIKRRIKEYSLIEGVDFVSNHSQTSKLGGRKAINYSITIECAKILCLVEKTKFSDSFRRHLIRFENKFHKLELARLHSKAVRRDLTDSIKESGINEKMRGHGYSNITRLINSKLGITKEMRNSMNAEQLKVLENYEKLAVAYLDLGFEYQDLKDKLPKFMQGLLELEKPSE